MIRSSEQHNYEWVCYRLIASETGDTPYSVYEFFAKFFLKEIGQAGELVYRKPCSLEDWEHSIYMEQIHSFMAHFYPQSEFINRKPFKWPESSQNKYEFKPIKKSSV